MHRRCILRGVAIDHQHDPAGIVARLAETAPPHVLIAVVMGGIQAAHAVEYVGYRPIAISPDILGGNDGYRRGGVTDLLGKFGGRNDIPLHQLLKWRFRKVLCAFGANRTGQQLQTEPD